MTMKVPIVSDNSKCEEETSCYTFTSNPFLLILPQLLQAKLVQRLKQKPLKLLSTQL